MAEETPQKPRKFVLDADVGRFALTGGDASGTISDAPVSRMDRIRAAFGFTHEKQKTNPAAWISLAKSFHAAARVLNVHSEDIPSDTRPVALNAALSLELLFKAILTKNKCEFPKSESGHDLRALCIAANVAANKAQLATLELMTAEFVWAARYPVPNKESKFRDFHTGIFERHVIRSRTGNVGTVRANPDSFPNWENYSKIWNLAVAEFEPPSGS